MNLRFSPWWSALTLGALSLGALASSGLAQSGAGLSAQQYRDVAGAIDAAASERAASPRRSLADLDRARDLLGASFPAARRSPLASGILEAVQNARIAVGRSQADLDAQTAQARGLLRKLMHDTALEALSRGDEMAVTSVGALASDLGLRGDERAAVVGAARAGQVDLVRALFEQKATSKMVAALAAVNPASRAQAYVNTARAMSWLSMVQDSPRAGDLTPGAFVAALSDLTAGNTRAFTQDLRGLRAGATQFSSAATQAAQALRPGQKAGATPPAPQTAPKTTPATPAPATGSRTTPAPAAPTLDALYAPLGRALVASGHGDNAGARRFLAQALDLSGRLAPGLRGSPEVEGLRAGIERIHDTLALRPEDVRALLGRLSNLAEAPTGQVSALEGVAASVNGVFSGPLRALVFALLGLLAFYPLYLLNLAFGGRNPYWRAISVALGLLLLPVALEGLASLGALLEGATGAGMFGALENLSLLQQPLAPVLWAALAALSIGLSAWGFRGICRQFGLLGRNKDTQIAPQPAVEWDEEL